MVRHVFWHPFSNMGRVRDRELVLVRGEGCYVYDRDGARYLDLAAGLWYCAVGHGRTEIADAVRAQLQTLAACSCFDVHASDRTLELADRLAAMAPVDGAAVFFTSGGSDSIDTAAKVARRYWAQVGAPEKTAIVSRERAYHGMNAYGTSLGGIPANQAHFGTLVPDTATVAAMDPGDLAATLDRLGPETVAAFIVEPVIGAGGVHPPANGYLAAVSDICRERDVLLILDEVITGFGRLGTMFAADRYGVRPDIVTCAKALTSGYLPLGAVLFSERVAAPFWDRSGSADLRHGYTYSGHATACAAALANLDILEREQLVERVAELAPDFATTFGELAGLEAVAEVRTAGLLAAVQLSDAALEDPGFADGVIASLRARGILTRLIAGGAVQVSPPYVTRRQELAWARDVIADAVVAA
jgi:adenosylmethionine-8-amino-7-oxononanoate aminotransferase